MDKIKQWVVLTLVASVAIVAAGWFLAVGPKRAEAEELRTQAAEQVAANATLETQLQVLQAQARELPKEQAKLAAVAAKIPDNPALPALVRALLETAESSGVELVSISPGAPTLAEAAPVEAVAPPPPAQGQTAPDAAPPAGVPADPAAAPPGPAGQLASVTVDINVVGDYFEVQAFVAGLETLPRALRITTLNLTPGASPTAGEGASTNVEDGRSLTTTISGFVYMATNRPAATAVSVPGDAAPPADATVDPAATTATPAS
jgi:Tfp pilus assembly protein PilO